MRAALHPVYKETSIGCACGNVIETRSTKQGIRLDICSSCHPFFTGKHKLIDTEGRVERFINKYAKAQAKTAKSATTAATKKKA